MKKALICSVYRDTYLGDCSNGGVTARYHDVMLLCEEGWREVEDNDPRLLRLVRRNYAAGEYLHAEPIAPAPEGCVGPMFGGNFIYTCDSRFPSPYPIPVHDRYETYEVYDLMTR